MAVGGGANNADAEGTAGAGVTLSWDGAAWSSPSVYFPAPAFRGGDRPVPARHLLYGRAVLRDRRRIGPHEQRRRDQLVLAERPRAGSCGPGRSGRSRPGTPRITVRRGRLPGRPVLRARRQHRPRLDPAGRRLVRPPDLRQSDRGRDRTRGRPLPDRAGRNHLQRGCRLHSGHRSHCPRLDRVGLGHGACTLGLAADRSRRATPRSPARPSRSARSSTAPRCRYGPRGRDGRHRRSSIPPAVSTR